jgi:hypothetical protein
MPDKGAAQNNRGNAHPLGHLPVNGGNQKVSLSVQSTAQSEHRGKCRRQSSARGITGVQVGNVAHQGEKKST